MTEAPTATLRYYGISPWEIEVLYGFLHSRFKIVQQEIEPDDERYVSSLVLDIPLDFSEAFFEWFEFRRWEKVKAVFKEMKRRRGSGNALKVAINFLGAAKITFVIDIKDKQWFDNSIDKIDVVLELLPYHLDPQKLPAGTREITYKFDSKVIRWRLDSAASAQKRYEYVQDSWKEVT